jgi:hypothetical protein
MIADSPAGSSDWGSRRGLSCLADRAVCREAVPGKGGALRTTARPPRGSGGVPAPSPGAGLPTGARTRGEARRVRLLCLDEALEMSRSYDHRRPSRRLRRPRRRVLDLRRAPARDRPGRAAGAPVHGQAAFAPAGVPGLHPRRALPCSPCPGSRHALVDLREQIGEAAARSCPSGTPMNVSGGSNRRGSRTWGIAASWIEGRPVRRGETGRQPASSLDSASCSSDGRRVSRTHWPRSATATRMRGDANRRGRGYAVSVARRTAAATWAA